MTIPNSPPKKNLVPRGLGHRHLHSFSGKCSSACYVCGQQHALHVHCCRHSTQGQCYTYSVLIPIQFLHPKRPIRLVKVHCEGQNYRHLVTVSSMTTVAHGLGRSKGKGGKGTTRMKLGSSFKRLLLALLCRQCLWAHSRPSPFQNSVHVMCTPGYCYDGFPQRFPHVQCALATLTPRALGVE